MTRTDFIVATSRYCNRAIASGVNPILARMLQETIHGLLREIDREMADHPEFFEHPRWGGRPAPRPLTPDPEPPSSLDCVGGAGAKVSLPTGRS